MKKSILLSALKGAGLVISLYAFVFWGIYLFNPPIDRSGYSPGSEKFILPVIMIAASWLTAWASICAKPKLLMIFSFFSFFPVGFYFIGGNSLLSASIGISYIGLFITASALFATMN
jgi:hypothetical protein